MTAKTIIRVSNAREQRAASGLTGRYIVTMANQSRHHVSERFQAANFSEVLGAPRDAAVLKAIPRGSYVLMPQIDVAVIDPTNDQEDRLFEIAEQEDAVLAIEPERIVRAVGNLDSEYVRGWRDGVGAITEKLLETSKAAELNAPLPAQSSATWGLEATKVTNSRWSGDSVKIAVLDTGLDLSHPDFAGREIVTKNFVGDGTPFRDRVGHGTHCIGTAAGPLHPQTGPRYGIAYKSLIFAGRVLGDNGSGGDTNILQGIDWAIEQGCAVISLSLGAPWQIGDKAFGVAYERAAKRALSSGSLLVVAAGNEFGNPRFVGAVGTPGNSPSALTVAAIARDMRTAEFSCRKVPQAPEVKGPDIAGPGVDVYSSWPVSLGQTNTISGTSMATPHVAGIAALLAESNSKLRGQALKDELLKTCKSLDSSQKRRGEVGSGIVQAPV